jgi:hypothetical protein
MHKGAQRSEGDRDVTRKTAPSNPREVVTLADLSPQRRVTGGSQRRVFGAVPLPPAAKPARSPSPVKDVRVAKKARR